MDDAGVGGHDGEIVERGLSPAQEGVTLFVAKKFELRILLKGLRSAEFVHLHGVVNHQLDRLKWIDAGGVAAQLFHGIAHGA